MKERMKSLNIYQKALILIMGLMIVVFSVLYPRIISVEGYDYRNTILVPSEENGAITYSGKVEGEKLVVTVVPEKSAEFTCGKNSYGPYTVIEDPSAISYTVRQEGDEESTVRGVELSCGGKRIFRGSIRDESGMIWLYDEKGEFVGSNMLTDDLILEDYGDPSELSEPSKATVLDLIFEPELTHKGDMTFLFLGIILCLMNFAFIIYAEDLFRWQVARLIRNPKNEEPSDWELAGRYMGWTVCMFLILYVFITGLA